VNVEWPDHFAVNYPENCLLGRTHALARFRMLSFGLVRDLYRPLSWRSSHNCFAGLRCPSNEHFHSYSTPGHWDHPATEVASDKCCFYSAGAGNSRPAGCACPRHSTNCLHGFHFDSLHVDCRILEAGSHNILWCRAGTRNDKDHSADLIAGNSDAHIGLGNVGYEIDSFAGGHSNLDLLRDHCNIGPH
jgi:hypothetical protein